MKSCPLHSDILLVQLCQGTILSSIGKGQRRDVDSFRWLEVLREDRCFASLIPSPTATGCLLMSRVSLAIEDAITGHPRQLKHQIA